MCCGAKVGQAVVLNSVNSLPLLMLSNVPRARPRSLLGHLGLVVATLVSVDLVSATECRAAEQPGGAMHLSVQEQALLVVSGCSVALVKDRLIHRLAFVPPEIPPRVRKIHQMVVQLASGEGGMGGAERPTHTMSG
jgi:hypothetical protein